MQDTRAQLGYDPFAGSLVRSEEKWTNYSDATTNGTNRPTSTSVSGVDSMLSNAASFNFGVNHTSPYNLGTVAFQFLVTAAAATINSPGGFTLTANTGLTTTAAATGTYTFGANYAWTLATTTGGITGFDAAGFRVDSTGFVNANGTFTVSQIGNDL